MNPRSWPVLVLALLLVATWNAAGATFPILVTSATPHGALQNDAGSGQDAGDTPFEALVLPKAGTYRGNLTPPGMDRDWYRLPVDGSAVCGRANAQGAVPGTLVLAADEERGRAVAKDIAPNARSSLALAVPHASRLLLGIEPPPSLMSTDGSSRPSPGHYSFTLQALGFGEVAQEGPDAGSSSIAVPDPCFGGRLSPSAGDTVDAYHFTAGSGAGISVSLAEAGTVPVVLTLVAPSGAVRATVRSGEVATTYADEEGVWRVVLEAEGAAAPASASDGPVAVASEDGGYLVGLSVDDGGGTNPCRPMCLE